MIQQPTYKKCRARYGIEQPSLWCKPCRRKKKCIRVQMYLEGRTEQEIDDTCAVGGGKEMDNIV